MNIPADDLTPHFTTPPDKKQLAALFEKGSRASDISPLKIARVLNRMKVFYVFVGGVIVGCWTGDPRATEDVDLVLGKGAPIRRVISAIKGIRKDLESTTHRSVIRVRGASATGVRNLVDLIRPYDGVYSHAERYFITIRVKGTPIRIPTPEMLVVMKYAAATSMNRVPLKQAQDMIDLKTVAIAQQSLDLAIVRALANSIGPTLGERLVRLIRRTRAS
jgi:Nucleotidyl transferase AbiEii toxin, Type IV TA system